MAGVSPTGVGGLVGSAIELLRQKGKGSILPEQWREAARAIERYQVLIAPNVTIVDVDLWNRSAAGLLHHLDSAGRIEIDTHLVDIGDAFGAKIAFRAHAVRADRR